MKIFALLLIAALSMPASASVVPTDFAVSPDKTFFQPIEPLHAGDRLQVQSPFLHEDDLVALARCRDPDCTDLDMSLRDASGRELIADRDYDDFPTFTIRAPYTGAYRVNIEMARCNAYRCQVGAVVLGRTI